MSIVFMLLASFQSKIYVNAGSGTSDCPAECSCSSSGVVVDCSNRGLTKIPSPLPKDTVTLNLSNNNITAVQALDLSALRDLKALDFSYNQLTANQAPPVPVNG